MADDWDDIVNALATYIREETAILIRGKGKRKEGYKVSPRQAVACAIRWREIKDETTPVDIQTLADSADDALEVFYREIPESKLNYFLFDVLEMFNIEVRSKDRVPRDKLLEIVQEVVAKVNPKKGAPQAVAS
ncbi:MAG: hypothetical protein WDZ82_03780 [Candidatus Paceibacterota bacterium]